MGPLVTQAHAFPVLAVLRVHKCANLLREFIREIGQGLRRLIKRLSINIRIMLYLDDDLKSLVEVAVFPHAILLPADFNLFCKLSYQIFITGL